MRGFHVLLGLSLLAWPGGAEGQQTSRLEPVEGLRENAAGYHALTGARVVTAPGQVIENGTVVVRNGMIEAVGAGLAAPAGARVHDLRGTTIYPGFIDAHADLGLDEVPEGGDVGPTHWNPQVRSWYRTAAHLTDEGELRSALRSQGFGAALAVPREGIFRGQAALLDLGDGGVRDRVLRADLVQAVGFQRSFTLGGSYPNSPMGTIALMEQTFLDADWYRRAWEAYESSGRAFLPPETSEALAALDAGVRAGQPVLFETTSEEEYLRAHKLAQQFSLTPWFRGSGQEYRILDVLRGRRDPLVLPLNFPDAPSVNDPEAALNATLQELRHWYLAPTNPARVAASGVPFALTSDGLSSLSQFLPNLRTAVARGLAPDAALAALTTTPAGWLGIDRTHGTIARGKIANLVVAEGDLFREEAAIREVWVGGRSYSVTRPPQIDPRGTWQIASNDEFGFRAELRLEGPLNRLSGRIDFPEGAPPRFDGISIPLSAASVVAETGRIEVRFPGAELGHEGVVLLAGSVQGDAFHGWSALPNGADPVFTGTRTEAFEGPDRGVVAAKVPAIELADIRPMMEYGRTAIPDQPAAVLVRGATVWTQGPQGRLENADLLVRNGRVAEVGTGLSAPSGAVVVDGTGMHVTPGLIDAHLHSGTNGTNEGGGAIVPEVRMGDVVTHNNIWMYRQLAGGLTTAHVKHGSANPIGGENVFMKMRWGLLPEELKLDDAPRTVKFALGENPKRRQGRYPDTRMGVQEIIRDHFLAARDYDAEWTRWERTGEGIPPRKDLRMEAIRDILNEELLVSSHGYRQDEFLALVRLAEEFGFRILAIQHGVEAYKIAPELAAAGVGAVVWSDWSGFKLESYDASMYNARVLLEAGVATSLHSDDSEIASRMNWEAGKLLRTGLTEEQALSLVTDQTAKVLRIDERIGSLEPGKDADFVIWNGHPLSQFTRVRETWIDGRRYFSQEEDARMREQIETERRALIQAILASNANGGSGR